MTYMRQQYPLYFIHTEGSENLRLSGKINLVIRDILGQSYTGDVDLTDIDKYSLGDKRDLKQFETIFSVDLATGEVKDNCKIVFSGLMHTRLHSFIRQDSLGIDYSMVPDSIITKN